MAESSSVQSNVRLKFPEINGREALSKLFDAEQYYMVRRDYYKDENIKKLRKDAVTFIETLSMSEKFDALIPYMAMTYFDRFISKGEIPRVIQPSNDNTDLFLICCITIAWKLRNKNFMLKKFLEENKLDQFSTKSVLKMELFVCKRLEWRLRILTPLAFVEPFIPILNLPPEMSSPRRPARQLIVKSQADIVFTQFRPSVVATSALVTVTSRMFPSRKVQFELNLIFSEFLNPLQDMVFLCNKKLAPLYRDPPTDKPPAIEERSQPGPSVVDRKRSSRRRAGKEPVVDSEIETVPEKSVEVVVGDNDELMNFELRWKEALEDAESRRLAEGEGSVGCITSLVQKLAGCISKIHL